MLLNILLFGELSGKLNIRKLSIGMVQETTECITFQTYHAFFSFITWEGRNSIFFADHIRSLKTQNNRVGWEIVANRSLIRELDKELEPNYLFI